VLDDLRRWLAHFTQVSDAWLLREAVTPTGGETYEELSITVAFRDRPEPDLEDGVEVIAGLLERESMRSLDIRSWTAVNEKIRAVRRRWRTQIDYEHRNGLVSQRFCWSLIVIVATATNIDSPDARSTDAAAT
jgi:hypothetical protein